MKYQNKQLQKRLAKRRFNHYIRTNWLRDLGSTIMGLIIGFIIATIFIALI